MKILKICVIGDSNNFYIQITQITLINNTNTKNSKIFIQSIYQK